VSNKSDAYCSAPEWQVSGIQIQKLVFRIWSAVARLPSRLDPFLSETSVCFADAFHQSCLSDGSSNEVRKLRDGMLIQAMFVFGKR
jgi:hypothetical protein